MKIHVLELNLHTQPQAMNALTTSTVCRVGSMFCNRILTQFNNVLLNNYQAEQSYIAKNSESLQMYWALLERLIIFKTGHAVPFIKTYSLYGIVAKDGDHHNVTLAFKTMFKLEGGLKLQEISNEDPLLLIQLLNMIFTSCLVNLKTRLFSPRERNLMNHCEVKFRQILDSLQYLTEALLIQNKPFIDKRNRLYMTQIIVETVELPIENYHS